MSFSVKNSYEAAFGTPQISYGDIANYVISCNGCSGGGGTGGTTGFQGGTTKWKPL